MMPAEAGTLLRSKMWLDFQNDVKVSDVQLAAREGYESVEHTKRYTTLGSQLEQPGQLLAIGGVHRTRANGEIVTVDRHIASIHLDHF